MKPTFRYKPLPAEVLADLFLQLAHLEKAGIAPVMAFGLIAENDPQLKARLFWLQTQLKAGKSIAETGFKAGLFNDMQQAVIHAAESSGTLGEVYKRLAEGYAARAKRIRKIKSRCYYPAALLTISLLTQPLPALVAGMISPADYLFLSVGRLAMIAVLVYLLLRLPSLLNSLGLASAVHRLLLQLPVVSTWIIQRQLNAFYLNLALMLAAGLSYTEALPKVVASIQNTALREQFKLALAKMTTGQSVAECLANVDSIRHTPAMQIIQSAEQSGRLADGLQHFAELEADDLHLQDDMLAEWLPRLVYAAVVIWIARSLLGF
jgi:type II secretory pathway component PulF